MVFRITVAPTVEDPRAAQLLRSFDTRARSARVSFAITDSYLIDAKLPAAAVREAAKRLANPLAEKAVVGRVLAPSSFSFCIEIGYLPGVTDNVGATARETIEDMLGRRLKEGEAVYSSRFIFVGGAVLERDVRALAGSLHNPLIERAVVYSAREFRRGIPPVVPKVRLASRQKADAVHLEVPDDELERIGREGIRNPDGSRRGPLALSVNALKIIREYFRREKRDPTDVELESLAQTWSEHCKHTIFADPLDEVEEGIYRRYIKGATNAIRARKGKRDFCVSIFKDNSGAIAFDDEYLVTHKVETHNSPSALDPFGGAITGIVGVNRDCVGFGLGAKPIANVYGFCTGDPQDERTLYRDVEKKKPLLSPKRILEGVVKGVNAGGNQSGIPTPLGFVATDDSFRGKPLVFAGTVGLMPRSRGARKLYEKRARPGDYIVMLGGRVGLDGIHGATFSSESLAEGSPATAVQIGDPITQKKFSDALIREARDAALYNAITDNGAGGLSSSVSEMARDMAGKGGCLVNLDAVPLKYPGLAPWQIWISESQERMTLAVPRAKWARFRRVMGKHGVEATRVGIFTSTGRCVLRYRGKRVMDMAMSFLHDGRPVERQTGRAVERTPQPFSAKRVPLAKALLGVLARPSVASSAFIARQYDHEVQGTSVTKPLQGRGAVGADAGVLKPLPDSVRGVVLSHGYCPWYSALDTYGMAAASIDTAIRNAVVAGAPLSHLAILDNFCWSSSHTPERLWELKRAALACFDTATAYGTPFISGKDSMFNDFRGFDESAERVHIAALPTLLVSAIGVMRDVSRATTLDVKMPGDVLYLLGETHDELGGSEYAAFLGASGGHVPRTDTKRNKRTYRALEGALRNGLVASALSVGRGGLAAGLAKTAIAGKLGLALDARKLPGTAESLEALLFSESQGRVLVSVAPKNTRAFLRAMKGCVCTKLGVVSKKPRLDIRLAGTRLTLPLSSLDRAYRAVFKDW